MIAENNKVLPLIDDYLKNLKSLGYSGETSYNYERDLLLFDHFLQTHAKRNFADINRETIESFKAYLLSSDRRTLKDKKQTKELKLSFQTVNRILSSLKSYLKYMTSRFRSHPRPSG